MGPLISESEISFVNFRMNKIALCLYYPYTHTHTQKKEGEKKNKELKNEISSSSIGHSKQTDRTSDIIIEINIIFTLVYNRCSISKFITWPTAR